MSALDTLAPVMSRPWVHGHAFRRGIETFAHHACAALGLPPVQVKWTNYIRTAAINARGDMLLPDCPDDARKTRAEVARLAGYVAHELLHRKYTDFKAQDHRAYVASLHNAIEDAWIERRAARDGLMGNIRPLLVAMIGDMVDESAGADWTDPAQYPWSLAVLCRGYGKPVPVPGALQPAFTSVAARVDACQTSHDTLALARWLFDQMQDPQQDQQDQQQDQQDQQQDGAQEGQDGAQDDAQDDAQAGQDGSEGQDGAQDGTQEGAQDDAQAGQEGAQEGPADAGPARRPHPQTTARETEPHPGPGSGHGGSYQAKPAPPGALGQIGSWSWASNVSVPARLRYEVRRLFENSAREWRDGGFRSGILHRAALAKVPLDRPDIFARRFSEDGIDSAVVILLDISGSMNPMQWDEQSIAASKMGTAVAACLALLDCLAQAGAQTMVICFGMRTHVLKTWTQPWRQIAERLRHVETEGDTNDYHALRLAHEHLLQHPAQRRVVFALTDGEGDQYSTHAQRLSGEALGIQHWCLGIQHDASRTWGVNTIRVDRVADLGKVAFQQIKRAA